MNEKSIATGFRALIYAYSALAHILVFLCAAGAMHARTNDARCVEHEIKSGNEAPFAFKVSLSGRRGNSLSGPARSADADLAAFKGAVMEKFEVAMAMAAKATAHNALAAVVETPLKPEPSVKPEMAPRPEIAPPAAEKPKDITPPVKETMPAPVTDKKIAERTKEKNAEKKRREKAFEPPKFRTETAAKGADPLKTEADGANATADETRPFEKKGMATAAAVGNRGDASGEPVFGNASGDGRSEGLAGSPEGRGDAGVKMSRIELFKALVGDKIRKNTRYPEHLRDAGVEGSVRLSFEIGPGGRVIGASASGSSGNGELDRAAIEAVRAGEPYLPFPKEQGNEPLKFVIPIHYRLEG